MSKITRLFRLYGNFQYGKKREDISKPGDTQANLVEIFHAERDNGQAEGDGMQRCFARVTKVTGKTLVPALPVNAPAPENNVFFDAARTQIIEDIEKGDPVSFWVCDPPASPKGHINGVALCLFGAIVCDQFGDPQEPEPTERFPLVGRYDRPGGPWGSMVVFGHDTGHDMRLELGFAQPVGTNKIAGENVLPFGGIFETTKASDTKGGATKAFLKARHGLVGTLGDSRITGFGDRFGTFGLADQASGTGANTVIDIRLNTYLPDSVALMQALGLEDQVAKVTAAGRVRISSRRDVDTGGFEYGAAVSANVLLKDETLAMQQQLGAGFNATSLELQAIWTVTLTDDDILAALNGAAALAGKTRVQLRFQDRTRLYKSDDGTYQFVRQPGHTVHKLHGGGLHHIASTGAVVRDALQTIDRQPASLLPDLFSRDVTVTDDANRWVTVKMVGYGPTVSQDVNLGANPEPMPWSDTLPRLTLTLDTTPAPASTAAPDAGDRANDSTLREQAEDFLGSGRTAPIKIKMRLPGFADMPTYHPVIFAHDPRAVDGGADQSDVSFAIHNDQDIMDNTTRIDARLGALRTTRTGSLLVPTSPQDKPHSTLEMRRRARLLPDTQAPARADIDITWTLGLAADSIQPVTTDKAHGDRSTRQDDLLIQETHNGEGDDFGLTPPLRITVTERLRDDQDRHLKAAIYDTSSADDRPQTFTVLTQRPWQALRFTRVPFTASGGATGEPVAEYDSDTREWRQLKAAETYRYTMPPAMVGEAADKPGEWEVVDPDGRPAEGVALPPAPKDPTEGTHGPQRHAVDMRLSPPTTFWVEPSDLERNYFLAQFNVRSLFREQGDFGIGVALHALRSEFIYGIATGLKVPDATPVKAKPRLASTSALTGQMLPAQQHTGRSTRLSRWPQLREALQDHAERLEIVDIDTSRADPYKPAQFKTGLTHTLRRTALMRPPAGLKPENVGSAVQEGFDVAPPRFADHGLPGGALWPLESANVAYVVARNPVGNTGELSDIALSSMGVSGKQSVPFVNGYVTVISQATDGHLHRHRVEVLGRIGVLWHRAKHVVVYERTTAPSAQFTPENEQKRSHRPILRKVEEFIEILEPVRKYPDMPQAEMRSRGCLEEVRFNSTIIHVNSAWGRELGGYGWEVPLWNRHAASVRPQVYPFPDVAFVCTAEGDSAAPQVAQDCLDMSNLYFYTDATSAKEIGPDTDLWPARRGADYGPFADAGLLEQALDAIEPKRLKPGSKPKTRRAAASRLLPGMRRYTWRVAPSAVRVRINAERGDKPVFAGVESISLSRSPTAVKNPKKASIQIGDVLNVLNENPSVALVDDLPFPLDAASLPDSITQVADFRAALADLVANPADPNAKTALIDATKALAGEPDVAAIADKVGNGLAKATVLKKNTSTLKLIDEVIKADDDTCEKFANRTRDALLRRRLLLVRVMREGISEVVRAVDALPDDDPNTTKYPLREILKNKIAEASQDVFDGLGEGVIEVRRTMADAQAIVADWRAQSQLALDRAKARVTSLRGTFDDTKPWSENRLQKALAQIAKTFDGAEDEAQAALKEARQRFATELDGQSRAAGTRIAKAMQKTLETEQTVLRDLGQYDNVATDAAKKINVQLDRLPTKAQLDGKLDKLRDRAGKLTGDAATAANVAVKAATAAADALVAARDKTGELVKVAKENVIDTIADVTTATKAVSKSAKTAIAGVADKLTAFENSLSDQIDEDFKVLAQETLPELRQDVVNGIEELSGKTILCWSREFHVVEGTIDQAEAWAETQIALLDTVTAHAHRAGTAWFAGVETALVALEQQLPETVRREFEAKLLDPLLNAAFDRVHWPVKPKEFKATAIAMLKAFADELESVLKEPERFAIAEIAQAEALCKQLVGLKNDLMNGLDNAKAAIVTALNTAKNDLIDKINSGNIAQVAEQADILLGQTAEIANEIAEAGDHAEAYVNQGLEIINEIGDGKPSEAPGLALKLISAATSSPEIAALKTNADRIRVLMKEAEDTLKTPELQGLFDQLGDALKALGLEFNFKSFGDRFDIEAPTDNLLSNLLPDFGGIDLSSMLLDAKLPGGLRDAVKVTHDLDAKAGRAWVQADVNIELPKRNKMFSIGPFTLYLRKSTLKSQVRAEASKDEKEVSTTDSASLTTTLEAVVGGQVMVTLESVVIRYSSRTSLDFDIDPKKIKIHKSLKFVQDTIGKIFGDDAGALKFVKENGIPVGVEHQFAMPPLSLMYGTSGVSNIQIANHFSLRAYPDFIISNRFNLSRPEMPFLFSFFIIGGTGFLQVDTQYRPFDSELMVVAVAGAGGSAALGFAFGPVSGAVFITLSVVLRYQKRLGGPTSPDDGLSVSLLLVIAGHVSLFGIVTVYLGLRLSIQYHESGKVDGLGQLSVEIRISRFFKLRYATSITYKLRDGQSTTQIEEQTDVSGEAVDAVKKAKALANARKSL